MILSPRLKVCSSASSTVTTPRVSWVTISIGFIKQMTAFAVRLAGILGRGALAAKDVFLQSDRFKMCSIHTMANAAQVIESEVLRDGPNKLFVSPPMSKNHPTVNFESGIAEWAEISSPEPTIYRLINVGPETFVHGPEDLIIGQSLSAAPAAPTQVMQGTPCTSPRRALAAIDGAGRLGEHAIYLACRAPAATTVRGFLHSTMNREARHAH